MTFGRVGSVSVKRKVTTAAAAAALSGGVLIVNGRPRGMHIVLTDRRILFFDADVSSDGQPGKHLMTVPATKSRCQRPRGRLRVR
jgi:hypothetical protein